MEIDVPRLELASLNLPRDAFTSRQIYELTHQNGAVIAPAETYETQDPSGALRIAVDRMVRLKKATVGASWEQDITPPKFADTVFQTYVSALQRVVLIESQQSSGEDGPRQSVAAISFGTSLTLEEVLVKASNDLEAINEEYERDAQDGPKSSLVEPRRFSSPLASLTMTLRGEYPVGITGAADLLARLQPAQIAQEIEVLFEIAGLATISEQQPQPSRPQAGGFRSERNIDNHDDDEYFANFDIQG